MITTINELMINKFFLSVSYCAGILLISCILISILNDPPGIRNFMIEAKILLSCLVYIFFYYTS